MKTLRLAAAAALVLLPGLAEAHVGMHADGLAAGALHPLTGLDHMLAMLAVGLWAARLGGSARWLVPAAFVAMMVAGSTIGIAGQELPGVEQAIAASVVGLGLAVAFGLRVPVAAATALVGLFALAHGQAHGAEMPDMASPLAYGLGFIAVTALLHAAGLGVGLLRPFLSRLAGAAIALAGVAMTFGA
ncbi:MAG: HupE/UreJ family protein [Alsobacter sp.]